jgi:hypothetical protein
MGNPYARMAPEKFAELPRLAERIELGNYDRALLAAAIFHETNRVRRAHDRKPPDLIRALESEGGRTRLRENFPGWGAISATPHAVRHLAAHARALSTLGLDCRE